MRIISSRAIAYTYLKRPRGGPLAAKSTGEAASSGKRKPNKIGNPPVLKVKKTHECQQLPALP